MVIAYEKSMIMHTGAVQKSKERERTEDYEKVKKSK